MPALLTVTADVPQPLGAHGGLRPTVHVFDRDSIDAVNAALAAERPLLVRGEPGCGKSQLARAAAEVLDRAWVAHTVDAQTEPRDLLWTLDTVARLADAQLVAFGRGAGTDDGDGGSGRSSIERRLDQTRYLRPGPLWWAFDWASAKRIGDDARIRVLEPPRPAGWSSSDGAVVLIDEIDKADPSVPNGLLEALGSGRFEAPGMPEGVSRTTHAPPLVIITTNEERALPDAFLRRCLVLRLGLPEDDDALRSLLIERGRAHFDDCPDDVLEKAADLLLRERRAVDERGLNPPGQAEYLDLVRAVWTMREAADPMAMLDVVAGFTLDKHPRDRDQRP